VDQLDGTGQISDHLYFISGFNLQQLNVRLVIGEQGEPDVRVCMKMDGFHFILLHL
jgi:hypothetical protein